MTINIDKDTPFPEPKKRYPFDEMEVGDSFFAKRTTQQLLSSAARHQKDGRKFTARAENDGARIWRVK